MPFVKLSSKKNQKRLDFRKAIMLAPGHAETPPKIPKKSSSISAIFFSQLAYLSGSPWRGASVSEGIFCKSRGRKSQAKYVIHTDSYAFPSFLRIF